MKLEEQLAVLAGLGLPLRQDRTVEELLSWWPRETYESPPFSLDLFVTIADRVPGEPSGRYFCDWAWNFDSECVGGTGTYVEIAEHLCRIAGRPGALADLRDHVDYDTGEAWIEYTVGGRRRRWDIEVDRDWADGVAVGHVMSDLESDGRRFYAMDNGQASVLLFLDDATADRLNEVVDEEAAVEPYNQD